MSEAIDTTTPREQQIDSEIVIDGTTAVSGFICHGRHLPDAYAIQLTDEMPITTVT